MTPPRKKTENECIRCPEKGFDDDDLLTVTLGDSKLGEQTMTLCGRCAVFILGAMGATASLIAVPNPMKRDDTVIDILGFTVSQVQAIVKKLGVADPCMMMGTHVDGVEHEEGYCPVGVAS